jgi:hypothetical protein
VLRCKPLIPFGFAALFCAAAAAAQTPAERLEEGNRLVRSGVYRTALLRYREAAAAGLDTPLLHYNIGVAQYRLGAFEEAAAEFARAAAEPALTGLASFNRGLALRAAGDRAAAREAFAAAAASTDDRELRRLAQSALDERPAAPAPAARTERTDGARIGTEPVGRIGELRLSAAARLGQDDNAYRAPTGPYVDLADPAQPLVTPVVHSASFVPAELHAAYALGNEAGDTEFLFRYDLEGAFYAEEFANATELDQRLSLGADIVLGERERRRRFVETAFFVGSHRETNFDPDDGLARDVDGEDIADRFSYRAAGIEGMFTQTLGRVTWGFDLSFERNEYERTEAVANFDHDFFYAAVDVDFALREATTLRFNFRQHRMLFDERPARDLTGALLDTNPAQRYTHRGVAVGVTRRLGRAVELEADYLRLERIDAFVGYYDYT